VILNRMAPGKVVVSTRLVCLIHRNVLYSVAPLEFDLPWLAAWCQNRSRSRGT
jgi:hypothetical protein